MQGRQPGTQVTLEESGDTGIEEQAKWEGNRVEGSRSRGRGGGPRGRRAAGMRSPSLPWPQPPALPWESGPRSVAEDGYRGRLPGGLLATTWDTW